MVENTILNSRYVNNKSYKYTQDKSVKRVCWSCSNRQNESNEICKDCKWNNYPCCSLSTIEQLMKSL